jgi:hypothetical protein
VVRALAARAAFRVTRAGLVADVVDADVTPAAVDGGGAALRIQREVPTLAGATGLVTVTVQIVVAVGVVVVLVDDAA